MGHECVLRPRTRNPKRAVSTCEKTATGLERGLIHAGCRAKSNFCRVQGNQRPWVGDSGQKGQMQQSCAEKKRLPFWKWNWEESRRAEDATWNRTTRMMLVIFTGEANMYQLESSTISTVSCLSSWIYELSGGFGGCGSGRGSPG